MTVEEYLKRNGVHPVSIRDISDRHRRVVQIDNDSQYYPEFFSTGLDDFVEGVDFDLNSEMFDRLVAEIKDAKDVFEPCCQSGLLGCYVASQPNKPRYKGIDLSEEGIAKAKARALKNDLDPKIFSVDDLMMYDGQHEVTIGRHIINTRNNLVINRDYLGKLTEISPKIVMIQIAPRIMEHQVVQACESAFGQRHYSFEVLGMYATSKASGESVFLSQALKQ